LHSASVPGILSIDVNPNNTSKILTGGADKCATVFNKDDEQVHRFDFLFVEQPPLKFQFLPQVVAILKGHSKKVNCVLYHSSEEKVTLELSHS